MGQPGTARGHLHLCISHDDRPGYGMSAEVKQPIMRGTVLVVDDDESIVDLVTTILEAAEYRVVSALGEEALRLASRCQPDVILLDLMMPEMSGAEMSRRLRVDAATAAIPIVVMTAMTRTDAMDAMLPINERLSKPFEIGALCAAVERWVDSGKRHSA